MEGVYETYKIYHEDKDKINSYCFTPMNKMERFFLYGTKNKIKILNDYEQVRMIEPTQEDHEFGSHPYVGFIEIFFNTNKYELEFYKAGGDKKGLERTSDVNIFGLCIPNKEYYYKVDKEGKARRLLIILTSIISESGQYFTLLCCTFHSESYGSFESIEIVEIIKYGFVSLKEEETKDIVNLIFYNSKEDVLFVTIPTNNEFLSESHESSQGKILCYSIIPQITIERKTTFHFEPSPLNPFYDFGKFGYSFSDHFLASSIFSLGHKIIHDFKNGKGDKLSYVQIDKEGEVISYKLISMDINSRIQIEEKKKGADFVSHVDLEYFITKSCEIYISSKDRTFDPYWQMRDKLGEINALSCFKSDSEPENLFYLGYNNKRYFIHYVRFKPEE